MDVLDKIAREGKKRVRKHYEELIEKMIVSDDEYKAFNSRFMTILLDSWLEKEEKENACAYVLLTYELGKLLDAELITGEQHDRMKKMAGGEKELVNLVKVQVNELRNLRIKKRK